jgi:hypothetical protein
MKEYLDKLYPYQKEIAAAVLQSFGEKKGYTFTVEIARQGGKNEISAFLELSMLARYVHESVNLVKCSPTFLPQTIISIMRLKDRLSEYGFDGSWEPERGYIVRLGYARAIFLSADKSSNVVGNTAHLLLEIDEAQDVAKEKYTKEFRPMASAFNTTTVLYGTTWDDSTLLEEVKRTNLELEKRDGVKRHFRFDWEDVAKCNPDYRDYVLHEKERLGVDHPLFLTQYRLLPLHGGGGFFSPAHLAQLQGGHPRLRSGDPAKIYVAGIDLAGEEESSDAEAAVAAPSLSPRRDATVVTIAELDFSLCNDIIKEPVVRVVEHYRWVGIKHPDLYARLVDLLKNTWRCRKILVDATGIGEPVASFLRKALGSRVEPFVFTGQAKSELGFGLLAAINSGRLKMYQADGSAEYQEFWSEAEKTKVWYRPNRNMAFHVPAESGHDDFVMSLALASRAGDTLKHKKAKGSVLSLRGM